MERKGSVIYLERERMVLAALLQCLLRGLRAKSGSLRMLAHKL